MTVGQNQARIAVIGAGYWGKNLVRNFHQLGALAAVVETDPERRAAMAAAYPGIKIFDTPGAALSAQDISAVVIATPAESHGDLVAQALDAGKHVFVEKPLCLDLQVGMELVRRAEAAGLTLMVGHLLHYHPAVVRLKEMVAGGQLGRLQYIYSNRLNLGKFRQEENILWSFAPHDISVILALAGEMPEHVTSYGANLSQKRVADVTVSTLDFPSGVGAHIFVNWLHPFKEQKLVVVGSLGMVVFDDTAPERKLLYYPQPVKYLGGITPVPEKVEPQLIALDKAEPLKNECAHFLECVATGLIPITDGREGLRVLRVLDRCQQGLNMTSELARPGMNDMGLKQEGVFAIHPTAVVDQDCAIGQGTKIWHFSHVLSGSRLGDNCNIGQNVVVGPKAQVGNGCKIQNNVSVFQGVILKDNVFCGPSMVFTNVINPRAHVSRKHEYLNTVVEEGASLGANCTIVCGHTVGRYAFVGAGAVVTKDVPDYALVVGNPARIMGWMCACGVRLHFSEEQTTCAACGARYVLKDGRVSPA